jgi:RNA polymerase sigma factor (sigma-70 family)
MSELRAPEQQDVHQPDSLDLMAPELVKQLPDNQQRVLRCLQCLQDNETGETIGVSQVDVCAKVTEHERESAVAGLLKKALVRARTITAQERPKAEPRAKRAYTLTEEGKQRVNNSEPCVYSRDKFAPSNNPYLYVNDARKSFLDCLRCLLAQGRPAIPASIALCTGADVKTVQRGLRFLADRDDLMAEPGGALSMLSQHTVPVTSYGVSPLTKEYLAPSAQAGCTILAREAEVVINGRSDVALGFLSCVFVCQVGRIKAGEKDTFSTPSVESCTDNSHAKAFVRRLYSAGYLAYASTRGLRQNLYVPTAAGMVLHEALTARTDSRLDCAAKDVTRQDAAAQAATQARIQRCISCITSRQEAHGQSIGITAPMVGQCLGIDTSFIRTQLQNNDSLVASQPLPSGEPTFRPLVPTWSLIGNGASGDCQYAATLDADTPRKLSAEQQKERVNIIRQGTDFNDVHRAINQLTTAHSGLAKSRARRFGVLLDVPDQDDLSQIARMALMEAAQKWDPIGTAKFSTFATVIIDRQLQHAIGDFRGYSKNAHWLIGRIGEVRATFYKTEQRLPTHAEIHARLKDVARPSAISLALQAEVDRKQTLAHASAADVSDSTGQYEPSANTSTAAYASAELSAATRHIVRTLSDADIKTLGSMLRGETQRTVAEVSSVSQMTIFRQRQRLQAKLAHPSRGLLAVLSDAYAWMDEASCSGQEETMFAPQQEEAIHLCSGCPVSTACGTLQQKLRPASGVWSSVNVKSASV